MSDKHKIYDYIKRTINPYGRPFEGTAYELGLKIMDYIKIWRMRKKMVGFRSVRDYQKQAVRIK